MKEITQTAVLVPGLALFCWWDLGWVVSLQEKEEVRLGLSQLFSPAVSSPSAPQSNSALAALILQCWGLGIGVAIPDMEVGDQALLPLESFLPVSSSLLFAL